MQRFAAFFGCFSAKQKTEALDQFFIRRQKTCLFLCGVYV